MAFFTFFKEDDRFRIPTRPFRKAYGFFAVVKNSQRVAGYSPKNNVKTFVRFWGVTPKQTETNKITETNTRHTLPWGVGRFLNSTGIQLPREPHARLSQSVGDVWGE